MVKARLREDLEGVLGSDFFASSNIYQGPHQRGFVHRLRDAHQLKEQHPQDEAVQQWARDLQALSLRAGACLGPDPSLPAGKQAVIRHKQQQALEQDLWPLCAPYAHTSSPLQTLCERVERFFPELVVFCRSACGSCR